MAMPAREPCDEAHDERRGEAERAPLGRRHGRGADRGSKERIGNVQAPRHALRPMRRALVLMVLVLAAAPLAQAQSAMRLDVAPFTGPQPVLRNLTVAASVVVPCSVLQNGTASGVVALLGAPSWLTMEPNGTEFTVGPCGADPQVADLQLTLRLDADAPALAGANAVLEARLLGQRADASFPVTAAIYTLVDVSPDRTLLQGKPQSVLTFPIHVRNLGNAVTRVTFDVADAPAGWIVLQPQPVTLQSRQEGGLVTEGTVNLVVQTPHRFGSIDESATLHVHAIAAPALGSGPSEESNLTLTATAKGFDAPGPGVPLLVVGLVAAAALLRKRLP
ncbi:MAG: hypothetical protein QOE90_2498 [Thermoplasmata archaeon]|jgi:hypothetical protein|nr:hypothetical protein [Thermoplasmata archaeon]